VQQEQKQQKAQSSDQQKQNIMQFQNNSAETTEAKDADGSTAR